MPRRDDLPERLDALRRLDPATEDGRRALLAALADRRAPVVARAARVARERRVLEAERALVEAFHRFLRHPVKTDPGCAAKQGCIEALDALEHLDPEPFLVAVQHVQKEPSWGPPVDTAANLRAAAAFALTRLRVDGLMHRLADLLVDPEAPARQAAVECVEGSGSAGATALLRLKARVGDEDPLVVSSCLRALLATEPEHALPLVEGWLEDPDAERRTSAVLALGESRVEEAIPLLRTWRDRQVMDEDRRLVAVALGLHRTDGARELLLAALPDAGPREAAAIVEALALHRHRPGVEEAVRAAADARPALRAIVDERFGR